MGKMRWNGFLAIAGVFFIGTSWNINPGEKQNLSDKEQERWVNSVYKSMSDEERIGQLFMLRAYSNKDEKHVTEIEKFIETYHIGGLCFFQGTPEKQAELTNRYQSSSQIPLLIAMDAEWGLGMRFKDSAISYPRQLMLGAIQDNHLIYDMGKEVARELRRIGVHVNFAPVVDVNINPKNPVINTRSFGEDRLNVAIKSYMYAQGMQDNYVMACAKHFPGHGDTDVDSHLDLPVINHSANRLDSIELYPFRALSQHGIESMMVAHLQVPALDSTANLPTTLSPKVVTKLLRKQLRFEGLIFTDALDMKGVQKNFPAGEIEVRALEAGNDVLLLPENVGIAFTAIKEALENGRLKWSSVEESVKRILKAKYRLGLTSDPSVRMDKLRSEVSTPTAQALKRKLIMTSLTLLKNENHLIPIEELANVKFASLSIGSKDTTVFQQTLAKYTAIEHFNAGSTIYSDEKRELLERLKAKDVVIVGLHDMRQYEKDNFGVSESAVDFINLLDKETKVILVVFGNPYSLKYFDKLSWLLEAYEEDDFTQDLAAQGLFGAFGFRGRLPVTASAELPFNSGIATTGIFRLGYGLPEEAGMSSVALQKVDKIAKEAIEMGATPGCVVLVARDGKVVYEKAFGHHTYEAGRAVRPEHVYDLASVTKVAATTLSIMKLQDVGLIDVENNLSGYLPELINSNKERLRIDDIMAHRAGLVTWLPFYKNTLSVDHRNVRLSQEYYRNTGSLAFSIPVATNLFLRSDYSKSIWDEIYSSRVYETKKYRYSDLGFYMMGETVSRISGQTLDEYAEDAFYKPLGLQTTTFNPWRKLELEKIPPTEDDKYFRKQTIHGYVHDTGAAMLGGVSGHAGLFSDANDLAVIMQMLLNKGFYGGKRYLRGETVRQFTTRCKDCSRRGLGFDMKELNSSNAGNLPDEASDDTFGHLGFTGTCVWVDPDQNLVYIFLSNRTYPSMSNQKINDADIRRRIHQAIYQSITATE